MVRSKKLPQIYANRGLSVSAETIYLNHLLSYVKNGPMRGLTNQKLYELGNELEFYPGLPQFFDELALIPTENEYKDYDFKLEHYVISTGLSQMILGRLLHTFKVFLHLNLSNPHFHQIF